MGEGDWTTVARQASDIPRPVLEKVTQLAEKAFLEMQPYGPLQYYLVVFQGPNKSYLQFMGRLTAAVEQQVKRDHARNEVVQSMAFTHTNKKCKAAILTLPKKPTPMLQNYLQVVAEVVPMMTPGHPGKRSDHWTVAATEAPITPSAPHTPGQMKRSFQGPANRPCALCGQKGHWWQASP